MADVLTGGSPDREPRRWRRAVIALAAALVIGGVGVLQLGRVHHRATSAPMPTPVVTLSPRATPAPARVNALPVVPRFDGVVTRLARGSELIVGGPHPAVLGGTAPWLRRLPVGADEVVSKILPVPAGLVIAVQRLQLSDQPSSKIYFVRPSAATVVLLTAADEMVAGVDGARVYALRYGPSGTTRPGTLLDVALSGKVLARHSVPAGLTLQADTAAGLLIAEYPTTGNGPADLRIVDRRTLAGRQQLGKVGFVVAATSTRVAWTPAGCTSQCDLTIAELPTGARHTLMVAHDYGVGTLAFNPDGRTVAVSYVGRHSQQSGGSAPGFVEIVNLNTGSRKRLPGVETGIKQSADLSWTPDGSSLAIGVGLDGNVRRVGLWPATGGPVHLLPGRFSGDSPPSALLAL